MDKSTQSLTVIALQKFKKNFWGVFSFWFVIVLILISVFAYFLAAIFKQGLQLQSEQDLFI